MTQPDALQRLQKATRGRDARLAVAGQHIAASQPAPAHPPWPWKDRSPVTHSNMNCTPSRWWGRRNCTQAGGEAAHSDGEVGQGWAANGCPRLAWSAATPAPMPRRGLLPRAPVIMGMRSQPVPIPSRLQPIHQPGSQGPTWVSMSSTRTGSPSAPAGGAHSTSGSTPGGSTTAAGCAAPAAAAAADAPSGSGSGSRGGMDSLRGTNLPPPQGTKVLRAASLRLRACGRHGSRDAEGRGSGTLAAALVEAG